jgi:hypothetical protein
LASWIQVRIRTSGFWNPRSGSERNITSVQHDIFPEAHLQNFTPKAFQYTKKDVLYAIFGDLRIRFDKELFGLVGSISYLFDIIICSVYALWYLKVVTFLVDNKSISLGLGFGFNP